MNAFMFDANVKVVNEAKGSEKKFIWERES
jgi:hypothetical protein